MGGSRNDCCAVDVEFVLARAAVASAVSLNRAEARETMLYNDALAEFAAAALRPPAGAQLDAEVLGLMKGERQLLTGGALRLEGQQAQSFLSKKLWRPGDARRLPGGQVTCLAARSMTKSSLVKRPWVETAHARELTMTPAR